MEKGRTGELKALALASMFAFREAGRGGAGPALHFRERRARCGSRDMSAGFGRRRAREAVRGGEGAGLRTILGITGPRTSCRSLAPQSPGETQGKRPRERRGRLCADCRGRQAAARVADARARSRQLPRCGTWAGRVTPEPLSSFAQRG